MYFLLVTVLLYLSINAAILLRNNAVYVSQVPENWFCIIWHNA